MAAISNLIVTNKSKQPIGIITTQGVQLLQAGAQSNFDPNTVDMGRLNSLRSQNLITIETQYSASTISPSAVSTITTNGISIPIRGIIMGDGGGALFAAVAGRDYVAPSGITASIAVAVAGIFNNPTFTGVPTAPTPPSDSNNTTLATTAFVKSVIFDQAPVHSVFGRIGAVGASTGDYSVTQVTGAAPLDSPVFTGQPVAPTPVVTDNSTILATTAYVKSQNYVVAGGELVTSVFGRTGDIGATGGDYTVAQVTGAAPLDSPTFTGQPAGPTPTYPDNTTLLATTAYVTTALTNANIAGAAPLDSPNFTGTPTSPTPDTADSSTTIATTAFVKSQTSTILANAALTGTPTAPTPVGDTGSTSIATTQYVQDNLRTGGGVLSFNNRGGTVSPVTGDYTWDMVTGAAQDSAVVHIAGTETITGPKTFEPATINTVGVVVKALLSQSADLTAWTDNTGAVLASISANGTFTGSGAGLSNIPQSAVSDLITNLTDTAHLSGIETFTGDKTFAVVPVLPTQAAHVFWAGPTTGAAAVPVFRSIVNADVPIFVASGTGHTSGAVPDPGATGGVLRYLREDASWVTAVSSIAIAVPTDEFAVSGGITTSGTITISKATQNANTFWAGPTTGVAAVPTFRSLVAADVPIFTASGTGHTSGAVPDPGATSGTLRYLREDATWDTVVTSIAVAVPAEFTVSSGITTSGTITIGKANQTGNLVYASPNGSTGAPVFRQLVAGDIPTAYDTLLAHLAGDETVTGSKTFAILPILPVQTANTILAGPTTGAAAIPGFRSIVPADIPVFTASGALHAPGAVPDPGATGGILRYLREDATWVTAVSSVTLAVPAEFSVSAGITTSGTITVTKNTQTGNLFYASPSGSTAAPTFRAIVPLDLPTLDLIPGPTSSVALGTHTITGLGNPVNPQDAVTKSYTDTAIQATTAKPAATVVATTALPAYTYSNGTVGVGATITITAVGILAVDGRNCVVNDIILVVGETAGNAPYNGLYTLTTAGTGSVQAILTRHVNMDQTGEFQRSITPVTLGTSYAGSVWLCTNLAAATVGTTPITFTQILNTTSPTYPGNTSLTTLGTVTAGTWSATPVAVTYGGTGQTTAASAFNALSPITTLGDIIYGSGTNAATRLAGNTTTARQFLSQTGTGTVSAAPAWAAIIASDAPTLAPLASPALTGVPTTPTAGAGTGTTQIASCAFVTTSFAPLSSPALIGIPTTPTAVAGTGTTQIASCAFVMAQLGGTGPTATFINNVISAPASGTYSTELILQQTGSTGGQSKIRLYNYGFNIENPWLTGATVPDLVQMITFAPGTGSSAISGGIGVNWRFEHRLAYQNDVANWGTTTGGEVQFMFSPSITTAIQVPLSIGATSVCIGNPATTVSGNINAANLAIGGIPGTTTGTASTVARAWIYTGADNRTGMVIRRNSATQSGNLLELQGHTGVVISYFDPNGALGVNCRSIVSGFYSQFNAANSGGRIMLLGGGSYLGTGDTAGGVGIVSTNNATGNRQIAFFASEQIGTTTGYGLRFILGVGANGIPCLDAVNIGSTSGPTLCNFTIGQPGSMVGVGFSAGATQSTILGQLHAIAGTTTIPAGVFQASGSTADILRCLLANGTQTTSVSALGTIYTAGTNLALQQNTDVFGLTTFHVRNRAWTLGALLENAGSDACSLGLMGTSGVMGLMFYEHRSANYFDSGNTTGEVGVHIGATAGGAANVTIPIAIGRQSVIIGAAAAANYSISSVATNLAIGGTPFSTTTRLSIYTGAAASKGLVIQGFASQSGTLTEWQTSGATVLASITSAGVFSGPAALTTASTAITQTANDNSTKIATTAYVDTGLALKANLASPTFTGTPALPTGTTAFTQTALDSSTKLATTAFVTTADNLKANLASPLFTGTPGAPTPTTGDSSTTIATTAFVKNQAYATIASPLFTGTPGAPTPTTGDSSTTIATTAFVKNQAYATLASPALTGTPTAPTAAASDSGTTIATTAFIKNQLYLNTTYEARLQCNGRLTLTTGDPIEASATGSGPILFTPYRGNTLGLYDGATTWNLVVLSATPSEISVSVPGTTFPFDIFAYQSGTTAILETTTWTNNTTRATALVLQDGIYVKSGATTRRYLGTAVAPVGGVVYDTPAKRYLWNYYNQLLKRLYITESVTASWTYGTAAWRVTNNNANNCVSMVVGLNVVITDLLAMTIGTTTGTAGAPGNGIACGIGYDSTTVNTADIVGMVSAVTGGISESRAKMQHRTDIGYHSYSWLEYVNPSQAVSSTLYGPQQSALYGSGMIGFIAC